MYIQWIQCVFWVSMIHVLWVCGTLVVHTPNGTVRVAMPGSSLDGGPEGRRFALDTISEIQRFGGNESTVDHFKILLTDGDSMLVGARNVVYNISLSTLKENKRITWYSPAADVDNCLMKQKSVEECQNYIRVLVKQTDTGTLLICGTNAYRPWCHEYRDEQGYSYMQISDRINGIAKCPYDPSHNNTAIYVDGKLFSATVADLSARDPLIYSQPLRTEQHDSQWLNEPNFVQSFDYDDKVYFFFRETAVEYINCGKAVFSRVARVCKNDVGGQRVLKNTWTSFFKARLNCSIPGEFPFYFDQLQSVTELGQGNYKPSIVWSDRTDMVYAVFNTPQNSIAGSAVCAYKFSDVIAAFEGQFKEQRTAHSSWLPVSNMDTPVPHPAKSCANDSKRISDQTLNFIKSHSLMDQAVPQFGGAPIFVQTSFHFRLTQIAIDWQVYAAKERYYDIMFVGTDDGRVLKVIAKGQDPISSQIDTVIIEDVEVFGDRSPIVSLKVYRNVLAREEKLIVVSKDEIKSIPLHRCHLRTTCGSCIAAQDPYCSWLDNKCVNSNEGLQSIETGRHPSCPFDPHTTDSTSNERKLTHEPQDRPDSTSLGNHIPAIPESPKDTGPCNIAASSSRGDGVVYTAQTMAIATVVCIVMSLFIGFVIGYRISLCKFSNDSHQTDYCERTSSLKKAPQNTYDIGGGGGVNHSLNSRSPDPNYHTTHNLNRPLDSSTYVPTPIIQDKPLNFVSNQLKDTGGKLPNGSVDTKIQRQHSNKVYI